LYRLHLEAFQRYLISLVAPANPATILDAGCGEGHLAALLREHHPGAAITGLDTSVGAVQYARETFGASAEFVTGDLFNLPFGDRTFDVVLCSEVLEHLNNPARALVELKRVARRRVVLTVPLEPWFKRFNDIGRALGVSGDPGHVQFWSHRGFKAFVSTMHPGAEFSRKHYYQAAVLSLDESN